MKLGFKIGGLLSDYGWKPGAVKDFDRAGAVRMLAWMREKGFEAVEFSDGSSGGGRTFYDFDLDDWRIIRGTVEESGLGMETVSGLRKILVRPIWAKQKEKDLYHVIDVAETVGAKIVTAMMNPPGGGTGYRGPTPRYASHRDFTMADYEFCAKKLKTVCHRLGDFGAKLCLEVHEDGMHDTADSALTLLSMIDELNVGLNPDNVDTARYDPSVYHPPPAEQMRMMAPHVIYWHIKSSRKRWNEVTERWDVDYPHLDESDQNFREYAVILWKAGFRGVALFEAGGGSDWIGNHLRYARYMGAVLDDYIPNALGLGSRGKA